MQIDGNSRSSSAVLPRATIVGAATTRARSTTASTWGVAMRGHASTKPSQTQRGVVTVVTACTAFITGIGGHGVGNCAINIRTTNTVQISIGWRVRCLRGRWSVSDARFHPRTSSIRIHGCLCPCFESEFQHGCALRQADTVAVISTCLRRSLAIDLHVRELSRCAFYAWRWVATACRQVNTC